MARIFLSYDHRDADRARPMAAALDNAGHDVWYDRHIHGGAEFAKEIEQALAAADVVLVLWSRSAVKSAWVRDEAASGRDRGRLVPVSLDGTEPPLGFRQFQTIRLVRGRLSGSRKIELLAAIARVAGATAPEPNTSETRRAVGSGRMWGLLGFALIAVIAIASVIFWKPWTDRDVVVVSVRPAGNDAAAHVLARDVAFKLGALQFSSSTPVQLIEEAERTRKADLFFEIAAAGPANAAMVLKSPKDSVILWSQDFEQPSGRRADLIQQVTYTAARLIGCANDGLSGPVRLKEATLKAYLNACAQMADVTSLDYQPPIALLLDVLAASPEFVPAWEALLFAEVDLVAPEANNAEPIPQQRAQLRRHISEARKVDPTSPAAEIAEAAMLAPRDFIGRIAKIERAAERRPNDPLFLSALAGAMSESGQLSKAIDLAAQAVKLDPLSPALHAQFTSLLAYGGNIDAAKRELKKGERLWPGTRSLEDAQYRFHYRYGDPKIARALFEKYSDSGGRAPRMLLDARQNPGPATIEPFLYYVRERSRAMENPSAGIGFVANALAQFDRKEEFFDTLIGWPKADDLAIISEILFRPEFASIRSDPRFLVIAKRAGLIDYWRQSGHWPDFCFESDQHYDCKAEAAKLK